MRPNSRFNQRVEQIALQPWASTLVIVVAYVIGVRRRCHILVRVLSFQLRIALRLLLIRKESEEVTGSFFSIYLINQLFLSLLGD